MTRRVSYSRRAAAEVEEITRYLRQYSERAARRFDQALEQAEQRLADFPHPGAPGVRPGTRWLVIGNYIVSYRRRDDDVEIFAVRHSRRRDARF